jgi:hypothetical protein
VPYPVDTQPHILEERWQVFIGSGTQLAGEKPVELWAEQIDQSRRRSWIRLLVLHH